MQVPHGQFISIKRSGRNSSPPSKETKQEVLDSLKKDIEMYREELAK